MTVGSTLDRTAVPATRDRALSTDIGLLILRVVFGLLIAAHGSQKLFGWFDGPGLTDNNAGFEQMGFNPGTFFGTLAGLSEFTGGLLLALGVLSPLGAAVVLGTTVVIIHTTFDGGLLTGKGYETGLLYAVAAAALAFTGPGRFSVDGNRPWARGGVVWGLVAVVVAVVAAVLVLTFKSVL
ncbi:DoxX family protein [Nocardia zapadnayensis]|uniref:DoxX family protein n=1 Tax=Nocardia rhamnosiphila TaxID=426716 RepID=UPI0022485680|nr:DoxX family protein [Nocardia zapadnayensis]MCX0269289.1 DoxX family protein [Nocardia zapadnayensis]